MAEVSYLLVVTASVIFMLAMVFHAAEWATVNQATAKPMPKRRRARPVRRAMIPAGVEASLGADRLVVAGAGSPDVVARARATNVAGEAKLPATSGLDPADTTSDSGRRKPLTAKLNRMGIAVTIIATLALAIGTILRGIAADRLPLANMYEFTITSVALVMVTYVVLVVRFDMKWLGLPATLLATVSGGVAVTWFYVAVSPMVPALHSVWFQFHIGAAAVSTAAFTIGSVLTVLFLIRDRMERRGLIRGYLTRLPNAAALDAASYRFNAFAFPLWTFTVAAGAVWAQYAWGRFWGWDPKETWALITWVIYACYLHARLTAGWKGTRAAVLSLIGAAALIVNFTVINLLATGLHSYAGVGGGN